MSCEIDGDGFDIHQATLDVEQVICGGTCKSNVRVCAVRRWRGQWRMILLRILKGTDDQVQIGNQVTGLVRPARKPLRSLNRAK